MKEIKAFECDFCLRYYKRKNDGSRHENKCWQNPARRACVTCGHFSFERGYPGDWDNPAEPGGPFCELGIIDEAFHPHTSLQMECNHDCREPGKLRVLCASWIPKSDIGAKPLPKRE